MYTVRDGPRIIRIDILLKSNGAREKSIRQIYKCARAPNRMYYAAESVWCTDHFPSRVISSMPRRLLVRVSYILAACASGTRGDPSLRAEALHVHIVIAIKAHRRGERLARTHARGGGLRDRMRVKPTAVVVPDDGKRGGGTGKE